MNIQEGKEPGEDHFSSPSLLKEPDNKSTIIMPRRFRPEATKYVSCGVGQSWKSWPSVSITLYNLPNTINTHELWRSFTIQGNIVSIDIFEDRHGHPISKGRIRFCPPPYFAFWERGPYIVKLDKGAMVRVTVCIDASFREYLVQSPARAHIRYPEKIELRASQFEVGVQRDASTIHLLKSFARSVKLRINVQERSLYIYFKEIISMQRGAKVDDKPVPPTSYRVKILFSQLNKVWESQDSSLGNLSFLIILDYPAIYHRKLLDPTSTFTGDCSWRETDTWLRQTRIIHDVRRGVDIATNLRKSGHLIDLGRWNVLRVTLPANDINMKARTLINDVLKDHNILVQDGNHLQEVEGKAEPVWQWIDGQLNPKWSMLGDLADEHSVQLPFPVRYQLEVCISHGRLSEFNMTRDFVVRLMGLGETEARRLLEHVATHKSNYLDPMEIFKIKVIKGVTDSRIPEYCCFMRTARVTPTTVYYNTPTVDTSNRITRRYIEFVDRFLRVRFSDEIYLGPVRASISQVDDEIYSRVKSTLACGITIGGRHYEFLAFGNSQFREQGAYFFASLPNLSAAHIRAWMGRFSHIRNIAKHTSRLGQCFSTTRAVGACVVQIQQIPDIERNGYVFSDGVGKISKFLAKMATNGLDIRTTNGEPPSAFQFRLGGCKGMLVGSSDPQPSELHIRPSQYKFESPHGGLEIIRWSSNSLATLNRQLILILDALGISRSIILEKQRTMLQSFSRAMTDDSQAISLLQRFVDPNHTTLTLANLVHDGFRRVNEPFVTSMLSLWKAWHFKYLKQKARIVIEKGANLFGVLDETGSLHGWFDEKVKRAKQPHAAPIDRLAALPEVFVQISPLEKGGHPRVIEGMCILARNPSLHPGDIRVVRAVNVPKLRHLIDVIVFPQAGDRDLASMCSGGDLDGDDYLVMWDPVLIPAQDKWFIKPMADTNKVASELDRDVTVDDMTSFFVTFMKNNCLPRIASAHMAWADSLDRGVHEQKCIKLAAMHSAAVDYNKTGCAPKMTWNLEPKQWPHFMEKRARSSYHSTKILGRLYDAVETIHFVPDLSVPFDSRILECDLVPASESFMEFAMRLKEEYDSATLRIMAQFEIKTEFEVWSTFVLNHSRLFRDYKLHEDLGRIASTLRNGFRQQCFDHVGGRSLEDIAPLVVATYRVTHELATEALARRREGPTRYDDDGDLKYEIGSNGEDIVPLISFPWIFHEYLGKIATGQFHKAKLETYKNGQSSGKFYTHAEVETLLLGIEQEVEQATSPGEDKKIQTEMTNAAFEKMLANIDVHSSDVDAIEMKKVPGDNPEKLSFLDTFDSGIDVNISVESLHDANDNEVPMVTSEHEDEDDKTDGMETTVQEIEIVESESSIPQSMLKQLLDLIGA